MPQEEGLVEKVYDVSAWTISVLPISSTLISPGWKRGHFHKYLQYVSNLDIVTDLCFFAQWFAYVDFKSVKRPNICNLHVSLLKEQERIWPKCFSPSFPFKNNKITSFNFNLPSCRYPCSISSRKIEEEKFDQLNQEKIHRRVSILKCHKSHGFIFSLNSFH